MMPQRFLTSQQRLCVVHAEARQQGVYSLSGGVAPATVDDAREQAVVQKYLLRLERVRQTLDDGGEHQALPKLAALRRRVEGSFAESVDEVANRQR